MGKNGFILTLEIIVVSHHLKNFYTEKIMPSFPLPPNPKIGCTIYDDFKRTWVVWNGDEWVDIVLHEHRCKLNNEKPIQD